jgi:hypothetical protein
MPALSNMAWISANANWNLADCVLLTVDEVIVAPQNSKQEISDRINAAESDLTKEKSV